MRQPSASIVTFRRHGVWRNRTSRGTLGGSYSTRRTASRVGAALSRRWHVRHDVVYAARRRSRPVVLPESG